jgi:hypothetical protein
MMSNITRLDPFGKMGGFFRGFMLRPVFRGMMEAAWLRE